MSTKNAESLKEHCQEEIEWTEVFLKKMGRQSRGDPSNRKWLEGWRDAHKQIMEDFTQ